MNIEQAPEQLQRAHEHADKTIRDTFAPVMGNPGSPLAELAGKVADVVISRQRPDVLSAAELAGYQGLAAPRPLTIRNAGLLLREAEKAYQASITKAIEAKKAYEQAAIQRDEARLKVEKAVEILRISALQSNGGEE